MSNISSLHKVSAYSFANFNEQEDDSFINSYKFSDLSLDEIKLPSAERIALERKAAKSSGFKVDDKVTAARGMKQQEEEEYELRVAEEVERRVKLVSEDAYSKGYEKGVEAGIKDIQLKMKDSIEERLAALSAMVSDVVRYREDILKEKNLEIYKTIKTLTRWIILRELKEDGEYIERLLEKLIVELETRKNILIQVNQMYFENMPDVLKIVEDNLGKLENVRIELDYDIEGVGIIVESENGIVDGTLDVQLKNLDELFKDVGV